MTTFKLGFLLAFSLARKENLPRSRKGKKDAKSKDGKSRQSSKSSKERSVKSSKRGSSKTRRRKTKELIEFPPYVLDVGNPVGYIHIEYELTWEKGQKQQIDIVCWNGAVKVFLGSEELSYRVRSIDETLWIPVFVRHSLTPMSTEDLQKFYKQEITFHIFTSKNKVGAKAKSEKNKLFFLRDEDTCLQDLTVPIFVANPNLEERIDVPSINKYMENIIVDCVYTPSKPNEMINRLFLSDSAQAVRMNKIIKKVSSDEEVFCKYFVPVPPPPDHYVGEVIQPVKTKYSATGKKRKTEKKKKGKKKPKSSKTSSKKSQRKAKEAPKKHDHLQMKVSGEVFFTDPTLSMYDFKDTNDIVTKAYVLLGVERLMSVKQKFYLNPMIIKIEKIENLNAQLLKEKGFKSIFVRYNVPFIARANTLERDIEEKIRYNEAHAHFTYDVSPLKFAEFIQSNRLCMEICGVREFDVETEVHPSIFGSEIGDKHLGRRMTPERYILHMHEKMKHQLAQIEVLAVARFDLTSLLIPLWNYTSKESCHNPDSLLYRIRKPFSFTLDPVLTANTINLNSLFEQKSNSPLTDADLIDSGTVLKVEVYFSAPATAITNTIYYRNNCYNRLLLVIYSVNMATTLLNEILAYNQQQTGAKEAVVPDFNKMEDCFCMDSADYLTGFVIDNGGTVAFFLEGIVLHQIGYIWRKYKFSSPDDVTVYFNTDLVFEDRLYGAFLPLRGIYVITLQKSLRDILNNEMFYIQGNVPLPCWEAVKKLDILFRNTTIKDILQQNLLPTPEELLSLNLEWGVPMRWIDSPCDNVSVSLKRLPM